MQRCGFRVELRVMLFSVVTVITGEEDGQGQSPAQPHLSRFWGWMLGKLGHPGHEPASPPSPPDHRELPRDRHPGQSRRFWGEAGARGGDGPRDHPDPLCGQLRRYGAAGGAALPCATRAGVSGSCSVPCPPATPHGLCVPTGVWARALGQLAGVHVPLVAMHHAYVVTERIEGIQVGFNRI